MKQTIQAVKADFQAQLDNLPNDERVDLEMPYNFSKSQIQELSAMIAAEGFSVTRRDIQEDCFLSILRPSAPLAANTPFGKAARIKLLTKLSNIDLFQHCKGLIVGSTAEHWIISFHLLGFSFEGLARKTAEDYRWNGWNVGSVLRTTFLRHDAEGTIYLEAV